MFRLHDGGDAIATKRERNLRHYHGAAPDEERRAGQRSLAEQPRVDIGGGDGGGRARWMMDAAAAARQQQSLEDIKAHIREIDAEVSGREQRARAGVRLPAIQRKGAKAVSFFNAVTSLGTSLASGGNLRSRSAIRLAAGQSAITVLPDLHEELVCERDRLASILGQPPTAPSIRTPRRAYEDAASFGGIARPSGAGAEAVRDSHRVEQREMGRWLDGLVASLSGGPRRRIVRAGPGRTPARSPTPGRGVPAAAHDAADLPMLPSSSTFIAH